MRYDENTLGAINLVFSSATRLSRAAYCGRWAGDYPTPSSQEDGETESDVSEHIMDGNLRHALLECYLNQFATRNNSLQEPDIWCILDEENWNETRNFLHELDKTLPEFTLLSCQKIVKKLSSTMKLQQDIF